MVIADGQPMVAPLPEEYHAGRDRALYGIRSWGNA